MKYTCYICGYSTDKKSNYNSHLSTVKHAKMCEKFIDINSTIINGNKIFTCSCGRQYNKVHMARRHIITCPHISFKSSSDSEDTLHECPCGKTYKHLQSYTRHIKNCNTYKCSSTHQLVEYKEDNHTEDMVHSHGDIARQNTELKQQISDLHGMFKDVLNANKELQKELIKKNNEPRIIHNTTNNTYNTTNNFNMLNFLNTECKDAMNLTDFIDTLSITFKELEETAKNGYIHGIQTTLLQGIQKLHMNNRPIHCTDMKRLSFYMKDNDEWSKQESITKINKALDKIVDKQFACLQQWKSENPDWENNTRKNNTCVDIMSQITRGHLEPHGNKLQKKVHKMLATTCRFDKFNIE